MVSGPPQHGISHAARSVWRDTVGIPAKFGELDKCRPKFIATLAAHFAALLRLFHIGERFFWANLPNKLGQNPSCIVFFVLGCAILSRS